MTRPKAHEIDEGAKRIFPTLLPRSWVIRPQNPDYRIDYTIELFERSESCGLFFNVQLKGQNSPRYADDGSPSFSLRTSDLSYYLDKVPLPVFLVFVDVQKQSAWWVFLQRHAQEVLAGKNWRNKKTVSIHIPAANLLVDTVKLRKAIQDADLFMRDLRPSGIQASIKAEQSRLHELDPRFKATIVASDGNTEIQLDAHQPAQFKLSFRGEEAVRKAQAIYEGGGKYEFEPGELMIEGSRLFELHGNELYALHVSNRREVTIRLIAECENNSGEIHLDIPGTLSGGKSRGELVGTLPKSPLSIQLQFDSIAQSTDCKIEFDINRWNGQEVRFLAFVDPLAAFIRAICCERYFEGAKLIQVQLLILGNVVVDGSGNIDVAKALADYEPIVSVLAKAKYIANEFQLDVKLPSDFRPSHAFEIETIHSLLTCGKFLHPSPKAKCKLTVKKEGVAQLLDTMGSGDVGVPSSNIRIGSLPFLDVPVDLGPLRVEFTSLVLGTDREAIDRQMSEEGGVQIELIATPDCHYCLHRVTESELADLPKNEMQKIVEIPNEDAT